MLSIANLQVVQFAIFQMYYCNKRPLFSDTLARCKFCLLVTFFFFSVVKGSVETFYFRYRQASELSDQTSKVDAAVSTTSSTAVSVPSPKKNKAGKIGKYLHKPKKDDSLSGKLIELLSY